MRRAWRAPGGADEGEALRELQRLAQPLGQDEAVAALAERVGGARVVMLGEASHGTHEYYDWRRRLTLRLVRDHGFAFVAVEGDWPDCFALNRFVKGYAGAPDEAREALGAFRRWPTWMWANEDVAALAEDLRALNDAQPPRERAGFFGLDVYSLWDSLRAVVDYAAREHPEALAQARSAFRCFEPYREDVQAYASSTLMVPEGCEDEVTGMLAALRRDGRAARDGDREAAFDAEQNALVARNAERYYRAMVRGDADSWNIRDTHMMDTLERLLAWHGPGSKGIVWAHNTHIGDARATDMAGAGMVNLGQLGRERLGGAQVALVGFGSHRGSVIAGRAWEAPMRRMEVPEAVEGSLEDLLHRATGGREALLLLKPGDEAALARGRALDVGEGIGAPLGHRAIGVVYDPRREHGNYVPTVLPLRYDAFVYLDATEALRPLPVWPLEEAEVPETFPSGV